MRRFVSIGLLLFVLATAASAGSLDSKTEQILLRALEDERAAAALYDAVIADLGEIRPFTNIVHAEVRHADHLLQLFAHYGIAVPEDAWAGKSFDVPDTRAAACSRAIEAEIENIALYDEFLESVEQTDIRDVFTRLRDASRDRHLPAFERCASGSGGRQGCGCGRGKGHRAGAQRGCGGQGRQARDGSCAGSKGGATPKQGAEDGRAEAEEQD